MPAVVVDGAAVERVVCGVIGVGSVVLCLVDDGTAVEPAVLPMAGGATACVVGAAVAVEVAAAVLGDGAVGVPAGLVVAEVLVSGSRVREAGDGPVEPSGGTVTSGTVRTGTPALDLTGALPEAGPPDGCGAPLVAGEDSPDDPPQAASSRPAMP